MRRFWSILLVGLVGCYQAVDVDDEGAEGRAIVAPPEVGSGPDVTVAGTPETIVAPSAACPSSGWCKMGELPVDGLKSLWGSGSNDVWVGGREGLFHWDGQSWSNRSADLASADRYRLIVEDLWGSGPDDVWAGVWPSEVYHWDGSSWALAYVGNDSSVVNDRRLWGAGRGDVWILNDKGATHWNGSAFEYTRLLEDEEEMSAVWGSSSTDVWFLGVYGTVAHWDGSAWARMQERTRPPNSAGGFLALGGTGPQDVWAFTDSGALHWDGATWLDSPIASDYEEVWAACQVSNHLWAVGDGSPRDWDGSVWTAKPIVDDPPRSLRACWGNTPTEVWAVGERTVWRWSAGETD
ncbi:MAG: hypothetical protein HY901_15755 [Deltaproteobacteria bacterium]|nr:hypothetical protein [Deltaproteobacteria bacterium]